jgi:hypothetical protein
VVIRRAVATTAVLAAVVALAGCNVGGGKPQDDGEGPSRTTTGTGTSTGAANTPGGSPAPYLPVPDGVVLTDPGSELSLGETASIAWRTKGGEVGVLGVKVRKLVQGDMKDLQHWQLDADGRRSALYFVTVTVANRGDSDLSGLRIPLYVRDGTGALVESSSFKTDFDPCPSLALPEKFVTGEKTTLCQAYLVPKRGDLEAVAFRATPKFNPITWVGKVTVPKKPGKKPA